VTSDYAADANADADADADANVDGAKETDTSRSHTMML
jgi:hypothetical protein